MRSLIPGLPFLSRMFSSALSSARNASGTWDLRCEIRDELIAFLPAEYPHALPPQRSEINGMAQLRGARWPLRVGNAD